MMMAMKRRRSACSFGMMSGRPIAFQIGPNVFVTARISPYPARICMASIIPVQSGPRNARTNTGVTAAMPKHAGKLTKAVIRNVVRKTSRRRSVSSCIFEKAGNITREMICVNSVAGAFENR